MSVKDFLKFQTTLKVSEKGAELIGPGAEHFGEIEGLEGHAKSISIRLEHLNKNRCNQF